MPRAPIGECKWAASPAKYTLPTCSCSLIRWAIWKLDSQTGGPAGAESTRCSTGFGKLLITRHSGSRAIAGDASSTTRMTNTNPPSTKKAWATSFSNDVTSGRSAKYQGDSKLDPGKLILYA